MARLKYVLGAGAVLLLGATGLAAPRAARALQEAEPASSITAAMRKEDPRLDARVTLRMPDAHLAEVLAALSARTGVALSTDERMPLSGTRLCVICNDAPRARVLNGLWSHGGLRGAHLFWERAGTPGAWRYRLVVPPAARAAAGRLRETANTRLERQAETLIEASLLTPEERKSRMSRGTSDDALLGDDRLMAGVRAFAGALDATMRRRVLRGEAEVQVPVNDLSPRSRAFVMDEWVRSKTTRPEPTGVTFYRSTYTGSSSPVVFMAIEGIGGNGYFGGVPLGRVLNREVKDLGLLPGDTVTDALETRRLPDREPGNPPQGPEDTTVRTSRRLSALAEGVPVTLIALRGPGQADPPPPAGGTLAESVSSLRDQGQMAKWRDGALLLKPRGWFWDADASAPWVAIERARAGAAAGTAHTVAQLARDTDLLTEAQARGLAQRERWFAPISANWWMLRLARRWPAVASPGGMRLTPASFGEVTAALPEALRGAAPGAAAARIHVGPPPAGSGRVVTFTPLAADGSTLGETSFRYFCEPPAKPRPTP